MANKIVIEIDLDEKGAVKEFDKLEKEAKKSGKDAGENYEKGFKSGVGGIAKTASVVAGAVAAIASAFTFKEAVAAAQVQEDAINKLNSSLQITGKFTEQASLSFQQFASELQSVTRFGDETLIQVGALINSLADLDQKGLQRATAATADLATALRIDINSAANLVSKALAGQVSALSRYGVQVEKGANKAETLENVLTALETKFGGAAANDVRTFSGAWEQLSNTFGDLLEEVGFLVTKQPAIVNFLKTLNGLTQDAIKSVATFSTEFNVIQDLLIPLTQFSDAIATFVIAPLELMVNVARSTLANYDVFVAGIVAAFGQLAGAAGKLISFFDPQSKTAKALESFASGAAINFTKAAASAVESFENVLDFPFADSLAGKSEEFKTYLENQEKLLAESNQKTDEQQKQRIETLTSDFQSTADIFSAIGDEFKDKTNGITQATVEQVKEANKTIGDFAKKTAKSLQQGFGVAAGRAFAQFGAALAKGENALEAFGKAFLKAIGDTLVQQGTAFILEGTAYAFSANPDLQARSAGLISSGAALAAFGGFLGASVSGGAGGGASATSASNGVNLGGPSSDAIADPESLEVAQPKTEIVFNVEGSLVQQQELAQFVNEIGNEFNAKEGLTQIGANFA